MYGTSTHPKFIQETKSETAPQSWRNRLCGDWQRVRQGYCMPPILSKIYREYLMKAALPEVGDFRVGVRIIKKMRFADDMGIIAKTQKELQNMMERSMTRKSTFTNDK